MTSSILVFCQQISVYVWSGKWISKCKGKPKINNDNLSRMHHWLYICLDILPPSLVYKTTAVWLLHNGNTGFCDLHFQKSGQSSSYNNVETAKSSCQCRVLFIHHIHIFSLLFMHSHISITNNSVWKWVVFEVPWWAIDTYWYAGNVVLCIL